MTIPAHMASPIIPLGILSTQPGTSSPISLTQTSISNMNGHGNGPNGTQSSSIDGPSSSSETVRPENQLSQVATSSDDVDMATEEAAIEGALEDDDEDEGDSEDDDDEEGGEDVEDDDEGEDDDEDDSGSESGSEDLEGSPDIEITGAKGPNGEDLPLIASSTPQVKAEPSSPTAATATAGTETAPPIEGQPTNILVPKKKRKPKRSPSGDEDLPPPPPPMQTIRLQVDLLPVGQTLEYNVLDAAKDLGMIQVAWQEGEDGDDAMEGDAPPVGEEQGNRDPVAGPSNTSNTAPMSLTDLMKLSDTMTSEEFEKLVAENEAKQNAQAAKKKKKVINSKKRKIDYDFEDPFIDDSDLYLDAPTHVGRPKKEGFFVSDGPVELLEESPQKPGKSRPPKKSRPSAAVLPKTKTRSILQITAERTRKHPIIGNGSRLSPINLASDDDGPSAGPSRVTPPPEPTQEEDPLPTEALPIDRAMYKSASKDPRFLPPFPIFPDPVRRELYRLKESSDKHDWASNQRGRFPEELKAPLRRAGETAYRNGCFGPWEEALSGSPADCFFFDTLPSCLPYNRFTLMKLVTKQCFDGAWKWYQDVENIGLDVFRDMVDQIVPDWKNEREKQLDGYNQDLAKWDALNPGYVPQDNPAAAEANDDDDGENPPAEANKADVDGRPREPARKYTWTSEMRDVFQELAENLNLMVDMNKKGFEFGVSSAHDPNREKDYGRTKMLADFYKKILRCFPPGGYADNKSVSREMSRLKKQKSVPANEA